MPKLEDIAHKNYPDMISFQHFNYLFDEDGLMKKSVKSALYHEMEKCLTSDDMVPPSGWKSISTTYLVDVMTNVRKTKVKGWLTFADFCSTFLNMLLASMQERNKNRACV